MNRDPRDIPDVHEPGSVDDKVAPEVDGSVYIRFDDHATSGGDRVVTYLLEIDKDGYIPREIGLAEDESPVYVTRLGEYGRWNDSPMPRTPPGSMSFHNAFPNAASISRAEFESVFDEADRTLPHTAGGTSEWWSLGCLAIVLVLVGLIAIGLYTVAGWFGLT
jgi:hypothetical protein